MEILKSPKIKRFSLHRNSDISVHSRKESRVIAVKYGGTYSNSTKKVFKFTLYLHIKISKSVNELSKKGVWIKIHLIIINNVVSSNFLFFFYIASSNKVKNILPEKNLSCNLKKKMTIATFHFSISERIFAILLAV